MKLNNFRDFDPEKIAKTETYLWQAYYRHNFLKLFFLLIKLVHSQFRLNYYDTLKISYYLALSVISFRINKGKENKDVILKKLLKVYKYLSNISIEKFDYQKTAELELEWWFVDRYPDKYKISRRDALKNAMASFYNIDSEKLVKYAEYRARAMELQDEAEKVNMEANWREVESLLLISYKSLYEVLNS